MTTIAANKRAIACDLQVSWNGGYKFRTTTKIFGLDANEFVPEPFYIGYAGRVETAHQVIGWLREGGKRPKYEDTDFLILTQKGKLITFRNPNPTAWIEVNEPFFSIGSGCNFAQAAMLLGQSPKEAIAAATKLDPMTGMGIKVFEL